MKKTLAIFSTLLISGSALAGLTSNVGLVSDYVWRGVSQTTNAPAVQGGMDYSHESGAFAGVWLSNVTDGRTESDLYLGYSRELVAGLTAKVQGIHYNYINKTSLNTNEAVFSISYAPVTASFSYTDDFFGTDSSAMYASLAASHEVLKGLTVGLSAGYSMFDDNTKVGTKDYTDYKVSLTRSMDKFDVAVNYTNTSGRTSSGADADDNTLFVSFFRLFE